MKSFVIKSGWLTLGVYLLGLLLYSFLLEPFCAGVLAIMPLLFFVLTNLVHYYLLKVAVKSPARFTAHFMATSFLKMFVYIFLAVGYVIVNKAQAKIFLINFLVLYIIYTTFEVVELSRFFRQKR